MTFDLHSGKTTEFRWDRDGLWRDQWKTTWSPDGRYIAFDATRNSDGLSTIFGADRRTGRISRIMPFAPLLQLQAWLSPRGIRSGHESHVGMSGRAARLHLLRFSRDRREDL
jgi:hypothetical protein